MDVEGRHGVLGHDARLRRAGQDRRVRHPLPRGGRRLRRPHRADGPRAASWPTARPTEIKAQVGLAHDPGHAARRRPRRAAARCRASPAPTATARPSSSPARTPTPPSARCCRAPRGARHRDRRRRPGGGLPAAHRRRDDDDGEPARWRRPVNACAYTRFELLRTFRNTPLLHLLARLPAGPLLPHRRPEPRRRRPGRHRRLGAALLHGRPGRLRHDDRGARQRGPHRRRARRSGWNRQLRITPLTARGVLPRQGRDRLPDGAHHDRAALRRRACRSACSLPAGRWLEMTGAHPDRPHPLRRRWASCWATC